MYAILRYVLEKCHNSSLTGLLREDVSPTTPYCVLQLATNLQIPSNSSQTQLARW